MPPQIKLSLPADIREYDEDAFILGETVEPTAIQTDDQETVDMMSDLEGDWELEDDGDLGPTVRELDIDDIFAKEIDAIVSDALEYHGQAYFDATLFTMRRPSDIDPSLSFVNFPGGTLLLDSADSIIGGFIEVDLSLDSDWQGMGLGREIVIEHFLQSGSIPTWYLDSAQYSEAGHAACMSAHRFPQTQSEIYRTKLARHVVLDNEAALSGWIDRDGHEAVESQIRDAFKSPIGLGGEEDLLRKLSLVPHDVQFGLV